jgi:hypothetical protein
LAFWLSKSKMLKVLQNISSGVTIWNFTPVYAFSSSWGQPRQGIFIVTHYTLQAKILPFDISWSESSRDAKTPCRWGLETNINPRIMW